ncbi:DOPA 4,5-dioxygenase [Lampropedia puyangensis]|uniref:DOPA 4,5-dioxygenase n=1 Tax=Lampropedia puyangensis TaxID=1330072 RepID=A0A4S8F1A6_9BURK|nr:DOPA 4,5-dioxygenase family protein [Lampropedia puyangensis]THU01048.1 DOPA 4,5-dioxygenase [Lampropedia puyangensis]
MMHAHVFFDLNAREQALALQQQLQLQWPAGIEVGPLLLRAAGPLPQPMFQIAYDEEHAERVREVLQTTRGDFSVLIHPVLEDEILAHTEKATWLGMPLLLRLEYL